MGADDRDRAGVSLLTDLSEAVLELLGETIPELAWVREIRGAKIPAKPTGTVSADEIRFSDKYKGAKLASISFSVYILVPDRSLDVEALAMRAFDALDGDILGGAAQDSRVERVIFGAAPGIPGSGAALLLYTVDTLI